MDVFIEFFGNVECFRWVEIGIIIAVGAFTMAWLWHWYKSDDDTSSLATGIKYCGLVGATFALLAYALHLVAKNELVRFVNDNAQAYTVFIDGVKMKEPENWGKSLDGYDISAVDVDTFRYYIYISTATTA